MSDSPADVVDQAATFVDKWRARWPEWAIARVFVRADQRELAEQWFALLQEWTDAASTAEPAPGLAKLAWWQEELRGWGKGARRHPLGARLQKLPVDWLSIAVALPALARREHMDATEMSSLAQALSDAEQVVFDEHRDAAQAINASLADALGQSAQTKAFASSEGTRPRRVLAAIAAARAASGKAPVSPWGTLRCSWRAARAQAPG